MKKENILWKTCLGVPNPCLTKLLRLVATLRQILRTLMRIITPLDRLFKGKWFLSPQKEMRRSLKRILKEGLFTGSDSRKLMRDAIKSSATTTAERRKRSKSGDALFEMPATNVMDVSINGSKNEGVGEDYEEKSEKQVKKSSKGKSQGKSKASVAKKSVSVKGKNKRKSETSPVIQPASVTRLGPTRN
ncbi:hypothetical protein KY285_035528 [Solanum tuberosum]|nr:hypothetical protein KY285_035528 [Solanum tuberosum]